ncbi:MAG: hypothetical protein C5B46_00155 [Proteobacteria bacterium]|nr:MAG: hypothetical protein C5B46_00155 [Pseudomonadota bacterium]
MNQLFRITLTLAYAAFFAYGFGALAAPDDDVSWIADKRGCKVANTFPRQGETITWSGECRGGFAQGAGVLQWYLNGKEDDRYEGSLDKGWAQGKGVLYRADGGKYDGEWEHSVQQGTGRYEAPDGSWYEGDWKNGKPNGHGQYRRPDGKIFIGEWIDGVYEGDKDNPQEEDQEADPNRT